VLEGVGRRRLIDVARGDVEPDLVIENARVFSVFTKEWLDADVAVADGRVAGLGSYPGGQRVDARGRYLVPGFIDAHVHIESSKLMVDEFARVVLAHGTTAIVADPHEIANVLGTDGIHWLLDVCDEVPLDVWVMASSCVLRVAAPPALDRRSRIGTAPPARARRRRDDELSGRHRRRS
jgi:adenine deaminase